MIDTLRYIIQVIINEVSEPESGDTWYKWLCIAAAHFVFALFIATYFPSFWIVGVYALKEIADVAIRRGDPWDSILDTGMVGLGVWYVFDPHAAVPATVLVMAVGVAARILRQRNAP